MMTESKRSHQFAGTKAAEMLALALQDYTARNVGGLRALAAKIGINQATVLSHMAHGRIGIPLDRGMQLARLLDLNALEFGLAVLQQRAPDILQEVVDGFSLEEFLGLSNNARLVVKQLVRADPVSVSHEYVISQVLKSPAPRKQWAEEDEAVILEEMRSLRPLGLREEDIEAIRKALPDLLGDDPRSQGAENW